MSRPSKVTPAMVRDILNASSNTKRGKVGEALCFALGASTARAIRAGTYPMDEACCKVWHQVQAKKANAERLKPAKNPRTNKAATSAPPKSAKPATAPISRTAKKLAPEVSTTPEAVPSTPTQIETEKEDTMLLQNHVLDIETLDHFKLERNPFVDDINTRADVFASPGTRRVRAAMLNAANNHGFIAIIGESGSGKTTLRKELEERIRIEHLPIRIIKPYIVQMEPSDTKGKTMKSAAIADAIARTLAPSVTLKSSPDARFAQVHAMLLASAAAGYNNLIVIEEAHRLPQATLRHLKGFMELEDGMRRVLGVCLIGQPELDDLLGAQNRDIREIVQRCNRVALGPLGDDLEPYLQHKFERAGVKASTVLAANAYRAIEAKLMFRPRGATQADVRSVCYPLMVNNLVVKAMNFAAGEHLTQVDAHVITGMG